MFLGKICAYVYIYIYLKSPRYLTSRTLFSSSLDDFAASGSYVGPDRLDLVDFQRTTPPTRNSLSHCVLGEEVPVFLGNRWPYIVHGRSGPNEKKREEDPSDQRAQAFSSRLVHLFKTNLVARR